MDVLSSTEANREAFILLTNLGVERLLDLLLVHFDLQFVLVAHLHQRLRQFALKVLLVPVVQLNHTRLVAPLYLPQFLLDSRQDKSYQSGKKERKKEKVEGKF